jgi:outer membrane immunogenic protein
MKSSRLILLATVSTMALATTASAQNWSGFYVGLNTGGAWNNTQFTDLGDTSKGFAFTAGQTFWSPNAGGITVGGQIGFNWQVANIVYGLEADANLANAKSSASFPANFAVARTNLDRFVTVRGRIGFTVSPMLLTYVTGGLAVAHIRDAWGSACCGGNEFASNANRTGWAFGGGFEYMVGANWTFRLEGLFADFGHQNVVGPLGCPAFYRSTFAHTLAIVRGGFNFKW